MTSGDYAFTIRCCEMSAECWALGDVVRAERWAQAAAVLADAYGEFVDDGPLALR